MRCIVVSCLWSNMKFCCCWGWICTLCGTFSQLGVHYPWKKSKIAKAHKELTDPVPETFHVPKLWCVHIAFDRFEYVIYIYVDGDIFKKPLLLESVTAFNVRIFFVCGISFFHLIGFGIWIKKKTSLYAAGCILQAFFFFLVVVVLVWSFFFARSKFPVVLTKVHTFTASGALAGKNFPSSGVQPIWSTVLFRLRDDSKLLPEGSSRSPGTISRMWHLKRLWKSRLMFTWAFSRSCRSLYQLILSGTALTWQSGCQGRDRRREKRHACASHGILNVKSMRSHSILADKVNDMI